MKQRGGDPTMKDVAREAGVSLGTVSKVMNGIPVGGSYRRRVEQAAEKLCYRVNNYARGLKTNRSGCVALVLPSLRHPFFAALADELTNSLERRGLRCILMLTNFNDAAERESFVLVRQNKADGVIALTYCPDLEAEGDLPIVTIDRPLAPGVPCVASDNYAGGAMAADKLLEKGCRRLLLLQINDEVPGEPHKRSTGFMDACYRANARCEALVLRYSDTEAPFYRFLAERIRDGRPDFDGIFCSSDGQAVRVREYLESRGVRVPADVQLIGYDGVVNYATERYDCSTIVQPLPEMAEAAVELLLDDSRRALGGVVCLPVRYAPGGTTRE